MTGLTDFQADVARLFFSVPASDGFLLAGGGALLASGLTSRPTEDLDFFGDRDHVDIHRRSRPVPSGRRRAGMELDTSAGQRLVRATPHLGRG